MLHFPFFVGGPILNSNFMMQDLIAISAAFFLYGLFAFVPGYVLGWLLHVLQFRRRLEAGRGPHSRVTAFGRSKIMREKAP